MFPCWDFVVIFATKLGKPIIQLTKKECHIVTFSLSVPEREFYDALLRRSKALCKRYDGELDGGGKKNKYAALFTLLLHLRQACNHPFLVFGKDKGQVDEAAGGKTDAGKSSASKEKENSICSNKDNNNDHNKNNNSNESEDIEILDGDQNLLGNDFLKNILQKLQRSLLRHKNSDRTDERECTVRESKISDSANEEKESDRAKSGDNDEKDDDEEVDFECPICLEVSAVGMEWISVSCGHRFCGSCFKNTVKHNKCCSICQAPLRLEDIVNVSSYLKIDNSKSEIKGEEEEVDMLTSWRNWGDAKFKHGGKTSSRHQRFIDMHWTSSSKLETLMETLKTIFQRRLEQSDSVVKPRKVVIFSQWTSMMDLIELKFQSHNSKIGNQQEANNTSTANKMESIRLNFTRLDGTMSQQQREVAVSKFNKDNDVNVFLVSLRLVVLFECHINFPNLVLLTGPAE